MLTQPAQRLRPVSFAAQQRAKQTVTHGAKILLQKLLPYMMKKLQNGHRANLPTNVKTATKQLQFMLTAQITVNMMHSLRLMKTS